ncbi:hypothetical protein B9Z37_08140 [Limnohabitans parvus II-B4]|uniref:AlgX/AlgJ SGNH hydrolase-like domain-containing protein n=2 Tax=Limnohabitans TaxID=665874 RepID=A0A315EC82_9BURK|nr:hypothetical protein B9Z37_08140 [Limnohabitans parvus II-B4]
MQQHHSTPYMDWTQTILFTGLLIGLGVFFVMTPKEAVSEGEKRKLAQFPEFSWSAMGHGTYMKQIDDFVADNFVFRYALTDVAGQIKQWRGWAQDDIQVFSDKGTHQGGGATTAAHETPAAAVRPPVAPASNQAKPSQTASEGVTQTRRPDGSTVGAGVEAAVVSQSDDTPYQNIESVIIYKNRAVQMLGGSPQMAVPFAAVVGRYQQELPQTNIYFMPIPIGADYYLPAKVNKGVMREKLVIDHALSLLPQQVRPVHAYEKLAQHTSEYVYFNTDHHWTGLGAYYAYTAFAEAAHITPLPLNALTKKEIPNFLGTLYHRTLSPVLKSKGDTVEYYKVPVQTSVKFYAAGSRQGQPTQLYAEYARGAGAYGVFLGGDYPMMKITSDVKNGRKIVVLKDSYGNAFVPYLASHYEEVYVLDYRHFNGNIKTLIQQEGIQDLLFAHNSYVFLSGYTVQRERGFLTGGAAVARKASASEAAQ